MTERPRLLDVLREDYVAHGRDLSRPGLQAIWAYRFGVWRMSVKPRLLRAPLSVAYRVMFWTVRNVYGIEVPYTAKVGRRVVFEHQHGIVVHGAAEIGDDCIIRHGVTLGIRSLDSLSDAPVLGRGVNVGAGAKIIGKVFIGDGAAIGANAVVIDDVPAGAVAVGAAARIKMRVRRTTKSGPIAIDTSVANDDQNAVAEPLEPVERERERAVTGVIERPLLERPARLRRVSANG